MVDRVALAVSWLLSPLSKFEMAVCLLAPLVPILHLDGIRHLFVPQILSFGVHHEFVYVGYFLGFQVELLVDQILGGDILR